MPPILRGHQFYLDRCAHFNGLARGVCRMGIRYSSVGETVGRERRYPCILEDRARTICARRQVLTESEARAKWEARRRGETVAAVRAAPSAAVVTPGKQLRLEDLFRD